jgi:tartrate-resistant acid phosphatase type 5
MIRWTVCALLALDVCGTRVTRPEVAPDVQVSDANVVRFVAVGDTGRGNDIERAVARAIQATCAARGGCALALLLGDNIYPAGVTSADDPQAIAKLEEPFSIDPFPFYGVLGNHDYGRGWEFWRASAELAFAAHSAKLRMPDRHYSFTAGPVDFFALDTNALFWGATREEEAGIRQERARSRRPWRIAFGHHPYVSNGRHGNAGEYDRLRNAWLPGSGGALKSFFDEEVCGQIDVYLSGHDHSLQDLGERCGTQFLVSGAGSETTVLGSRNPAAFQAATPGFLLVEATQTTIRFTFFDQVGRELHSHEVLARSRN